MRKKKMLKKCWKKKLKNAGEKDEKKLKKPHSFESCFLFAAGYGKEAQGVPALSSSGIFLQASGASE